ncbi:MAG: NAD(P)H-binding protein [Armatimonadetes bacterium]|nr:NAD(P)H-binding protein [Anaerolineae bacterium]
MKILITTPNGKVGSGVAKALLAQGIDVRIGAHTVDKARQAFPGADVVPFAYGDDASVTAALDGVTALYSAAPGDMPADIQNRTIDLAKAAGVQRVVRLSAFGVEQGESSLRAVEQHIEASSLQWTHLRPSWFMQNYSTIWAGGIRQGALTEPAADAKTAHIDTRDISAVAVKALLEDGHHGQGYPLTGAEALDRHQVVAYLSEVAGFPVQYIAQTEDEYRATMAPFMSPHYLEIMSALYAGVRAGWSATVTDTVAGLLGRAPISFKQFAQDHAAVWAQQTERAV